jgi:N-acetylmuramoyl-L-alanine amidase
MQSIKGGAMNFFSVHHHSDNLHLKKYVNILFTALGVMLLLISLYAITHQKYFSVPDLTKGMTTAEVDRQLKCLATNIYHEARGESFEGKVAVAQVTVNRSQAPGFAPDVCGVVHQRTFFSGRMVCQFSWLCENQSRGMDQEAYNESMNVAKKVFLEGFRLDILTDAVYYHADYVNPRWKKQKVAKIGKHVFYRERI